MKKTKKTLTIRRKSSMILASNQGISEIDTQKMDSQNQKNIAADSAKTVEKQAAQSATPAANYSSVYLKGLAMMGYTTGLIFGPLIVFVGIGWWLSERFDQKWIVFVGAIIALITSNILIFRNTAKFLDKLKG